MYNFNPPPAKGTKNANLPRYCTTKQKSVLLFYDFKNNKKIPFLRK